MKQKEFKPVKSPFGTGIDEQATTAAFEEYVGGVQRAQQLFRIYKESYPASSGSYGNKGKTKTEVFRGKAIQGGFTKCEIDAFLTLQ